MAAASNHNNNNNNNNDYYNNDDCNKYKNPQGIIVFDEDNKTISISRFFYICSQSINTSTKESPNRYAIILRFRGISYYCSINLRYNGKPNDFYIKVHNTEGICNNTDDVLSKDNNTNFMSMYVEDGIGNSALTTRLPFQVIPGLTRLYSFMYIRCRFYWMIGQEWYKVEDAARGNCEDHPNDYPLFLYRLLCPRADGSYYPINELSIYYRFYTHYWHYHPGHPKHRQPINFADPELQGIVDRMREYVATDPDLSKNSKFIRFTADSDNCRLQALYLLRLWAKFNKENPRVWQDIVENLSIFLANNMRCKYYPGGEFSVALTAKDAARVKAVIALDRTANAVEPSRASANKNHTRSKSRNAPSRV